MIYIRTGSGEPIYEQILRQIKHAITTGALKPGDQLPTVRELAGKLVINPNTVARAYRELEVLGLVESNTRRGTIVTFSPPGMLAKERKKRVQPFLDQLVAESRLLSFSDEEIREMLQETQKKFGKNSDIAGKGDQ